MPKIPAGWTKTERWVWKQIADGYQADLNARDDAEALDPKKGEGWGEERRISAEFLQTILTRNEFVEATPYGGTRILGALIDDAPLALAYARFRHSLWLDNSRILVVVRCNNIRVDGELSFDGSYFEETVNLDDATVTGGVLFRSGATFNGELFLRDINIGSSLEMDRSTVEGKFHLNSARVTGNAFLRNSSFNGGLTTRGARIGSNLEVDGSTFEDDVDMDSTAVVNSAFLRGATFNGALDMRGTQFSSYLDIDGSTIEGEVNLDSATLSGNTFLRGATFNGGLILRAARVGAILDLDGSTFKKDIDLDSATVVSNLFLRRATLEGGVDLRGAHIGSNVETDGSTFDGNFNLDSATVTANAFFRNATFKGALNLVDASIGSALYLHGSTFEGRVYLTGCQVSGDFLLGFSEESAARWGDYASLTLRNTSVGALQDWWQDRKVNAWPSTYRVEGFTYDRLGTIGAGKEADMLKRPVDAYVDWLQGDPGSSPQPYEHLADQFRKAGEPHKATSILFAARQRQRRRAWSTTTDDHGNPNRWFWLPALGLSILELTIGYGLGNRYFRVLWWVGSLTLLGMFVLMFFGSHSATSWPRLLFASLDQLLPIVTLDRAHDALIFGNPGSNPPVAPQPYGVLLYFYAHKLLGWVLGSFLIAGLGGLTQRN